MWEKNKGTTKCDKRANTCDVGITQYKDGTIKCKKKKWGNQPNVTKELWHVMLELHNVRMESSNVIKRNTKYKKRTLTYDVGTAQYENRMWG